jgi:hypothetical protein
MLYRVCRCAREERESLKGGDRVKPGVDGGGWRVGRRVMSCAHLEAKGSGHAAVPGTGSGNQAQTGGEVWLAWRSMFRA